MQKFYTFFIGVILLLLNFYAFSQDSLKTYAIPAVEIQAPRLNKYTIGSKIQTLDSIQLNSNSNASLANLLLRCTPIYLKEYGNGMLASIAFRGTGANHTAVLWNNINLNLPSVGQSDFSTIPNFVFEEIGIQYGGGSALYGSDALGGSIHLLEKKPIWQPSKKILLQQTVGSFGQYFSGLQFHLGTNKMVSKTKIYSNSNQNNFSFINTAKFGTPLERQTHAANHNEGIWQSFAFKIKKNQTLTTQAWWHQQYRQIQPTMAANNLAQNSEQQADKSLRLFSAYTIDEKNYTTSLKVGFIQDRTFYQQLLQGFETVSNRYFTQWQTEHHVSKNIYLQWGGNFNHIQANSINYLGEIYENRTDIFASLKTQILPFWSTSINLRQNFVAGYHAPFAPSFGSELRILKNPSQNLHWKILTSKNYRSPTLNERYWVPGGVRSILPEEGWQAETGLVYTFEKRFYKISLENTFYKMWMANWILWLPKGPYWSPENIRKVQNTGYEAMLKIEWQLNEVKIKTGGSYSYNVALNKTGLNELDRSVDKQLPYTPQHTMNLFIEAFYKKFYANLQGNYTGVRYTTTDNEEFLPDFTLVNVNLGKTILLNKHNFYLSIGANNLFNKFYQNYRLLAMPGRSYQISLKYNLNL